MHICKYHAIATYVNKFGKTTIRPNERFAVVKITDRVMIGYIIRKEEAVKVTVCSKQVDNFIRV